LVSLNFSVISLAPLGPPDRTGFFELLSNPGDSCSP
jgi:hypothetical protein